MRVPGWMKPYSPPHPGIQFSNRTFTEPAPFALAVPPVSSGIYAVLAPDASCRPQPFRAIYFGESSNFHQRVTATHEHLDEWAREAGGADRTYVAFCPTPLLNAAQRRWIESDLIARYQPVCNVRNNRPPFFYQPLMGGAR